MHPDYGIRKVDSVKKRNSITLVSIMLLSLFAAIEIPQAEASDVVLTDPIQIVNSGTQYSDRMMAISGDSNGNIHLVFSRNTQHLYYQMQDPRGETIIDATQISNPGSHRAWHPDIAVDSDDKVHVVWTDKAGQYSIMYTLLDPYLDDRDGSPALDSVISVVNDYEVANNPQNRDYPAIDVDSNNDPHIVWEDAFEPLEKFYQQPQIYYKMLEIDYVTREALIAIDSTLLTPILGHKGHPDIAVDVDDFVQIVWDDTRGGKVEMVVPIDTSGSMNTEWADMCVVFYGGNFASGGSFPGLKPLLESANMSVYETLYALSGNWPAASQSGACATAYQTGGSGSQGPRSTPLGDSENSGGIRYLDEVVYNNAAVDLPADGGYYSEFWGPAATWACLSWYDANGNVPGNPPTQLDHKWNPNATKIVIPISDEGPYGGTPMDNDDTVSISESHDACVTADIVPTPLWAGSDTDVASYMMDLAQCPNGSGLNARTCNGNNLRLTNAGGQMYGFPTSSSSSAELEIMVEAMVYLSTNNSREIYMTVLDPLSLLDRPWPGWVKGDPGTEVDSNTNTYTEDLGPSEDISGYGHLVVVNDTRITLNDAYSLHPAIALDSTGLTHLAWQDGRAYGFDIDVNYEVYYTRLKLRGAAEWDGAAEGLPTYGIKQIADAAISDVEGLQGIDPNRPFGGNSHLPSIITDSFDNVHLAWLDNYNETQGETVVYTRLNHTNDDYPDGFPLNSIASAIFDPWTIIPVTSWQSDKLGPNSPATPDLGQTPAFANDLGSGAHLGWSDTNKCNEENNAGKYTLCYVHVLTGLVDISLACDEKLIANPNLEGYYYDCPEETETFYHTIFPGELTTYNMTIANPTPGPAELVKDTFTVTMSGIPQNWSATLFYATNNTPIFESTPVHLEGGEVVPIYLKLRAPTIYQAKEDELAQVKITAVSYKDIAIFNEKLTLTLMDVVHGIELDTSHYQVDIEQGRSAIFSISVKNTGNVYDTFAFYDPSTLEGQNEWALPFGWGIDFPTSISLDPLQSVTKNLQVSVPTSQEPGTFVIYLKGWSMGEPVLSIDRGTFDVLELWINVSTRTTGNIVFSVGETTQYVLPGECAEFDIDVTKHFTPGHLVFNVPGAPPDKPSNWTEETWRYDHWTVDLDFSNAPGGNGPADDAPRYWAQINTPYTVTAIMCAPYNATAGLGDSVSVRAHLDGQPKIRDSVVILTNVIQRYDLQATVPETILDLYPGQPYQMNTTIENLGNGADRFDVTIDSIIDSDGNSHVWDIEIPRILFGELDRDEIGEYQIIINVPEKTLAGQYTVNFNIYSEEEYEGSKLRDIISLKVNIIEFHDMRITLDPSVESKIKTTAPSRIVRFTLNVTNFGNVPDQPTIHNHTIDAAGGWGVMPGMNTLSNWEIKFALLEDFDTEYPIENLCLGQSPDFLTLSEPIPSEGCYLSAQTGALTLPMMEAYTTLQIVVIVSIAPDAALQNREIGIKAISMHGSSDNGGDYDETPGWEDSCTLDTNKDGIPDNYKPDCDNNEQILELRLRAPDLEILEVTTGAKKGAIGEMLSVSVKIVNRGNAHATDVNVILCKDQSPSNIKKNGCDETNIVYRQIIKAIMPIGAGGLENPDPITLLYMVEAGNHDIVVVVDADNDIVETDETNNIMRIPGGELSSTFGTGDVIIDVIARYSVPTIILGATFSLIGVAGYVMYGRRLDALQAFAEKTSLMSKNDDEDTRF